MLTNQEIAKIVSEFSWYPGWTFDVYEHQFEGLRIRIIGRHVEDSYNPGKYVDLGIDDFLPPFETRKQLRDWIIWRLERINSHEAREWFLDNGERVYDPHDSDELEEVGRKIDG